MRRRIVTWIVCAALAAATGIPGWRAAQGVPLSGLGDPTLLSPIAALHADPSLFPGDAWLAATAPVFSTWYSAILAPLQDAAGGPSEALALLAMVRVVVLLAGTWRLVATWTGGRAAEWAGGAAALLFAILPAWSPRTEWAPGTGEALPRDLVFSAFPWCILLLGGGMDRSPSPRRVLAVFGALGLLANVHPLTALHLGLLLGGAALVVHPEFRRAAPVAAAAAGFAAGALPYILRWVDLPRTVGEVDPIVRGWHLQTMAGETLSEVAIKMEAPVLVGVTSLLAWRAVRRGGGTAPRGLPAMLWIALVVGAVGGLLPHVLPWTMQLLFGRFHRIAGFLALASSVAVTARLVEMRRPVWALACAAALAAASAAPMAVARLAGGKPRAASALVARAIERRLGIPPGRPWPADLPGREGTVDPQHLPERAPFLAVCAFARESTPKDATFLVPPEEWGPFRSHARRGAAVTRKEGGAALSYLGARGMDWYRDYRDAVSCYRSGRPDEWLALARKHGATWAVMDRAAAAPPWPEAFSAGGYRVLRVPGE